MEKGKFFTLCRPKSNRRGAAVKREGEEDWPGAEYLRVQNMTNLLKQAINCDESDHAAEIITDALGIESDELANLCLRHWPSERKNRARAIGHWLHAEAQFLD